MYQERRDRLPGVVRNPASSPLVADIARCLVEDGAFVVRVDIGEFGTAHLQAVVDVGWAARRAGQLLARPVRVTTQPAEDDGRLVVTAEFADATA
jgi:hypothetical protein